MKEIKAGLLRLIVEADGYYANQQSHKITPRHVEALQLSGLPLDRWDMQTPIPVCQHKWVFLRDGGTIEVSYRRWKQVDVFFCEKCLEQRRTENEIPETRRSHSW
jgi:hypothetical protein